MSKTKNFLADIAGQPLSDMARGMAWWFGAFRPESLYEPPDANKIVVLGIEAATLEPELVDDLLAAETLNPLVAESTRERIFKDTVRALLPHDYAKLVMEKIMFGAENTIRVYEVLDLRKEIVDYYKVYPELKKQYEGKYHMEVTIREVIDDSFTPLFNEATAQRGLMVAKLSDISSKLDQTLEKVDSMGITLTQIAAKLK